MVTEQVPSQDRDLESWSSRLVFLRRLQGRLGNQPDCPLKEDISKEILLRMKSTPFTAERASELEKTEAKRKASAPSSQDMWDDIPCGPSALSTAAKIKIILILLVVLSFAYQFWKAVGAGS